MLLTGEVGDVRSQGSSWCRGRRLVIWPHSWGDCCSLSKPWISGLQKKVRWVLWLGYLHTILRADRNQPPCWFVWQKCGCSSELGSYPSFQRMSFYQNRNCTLGNKPHFKNAQVPVASYANFMFKREILSKRRMGQPGKYVVTPPVIVRMWFIS